MGVSNASESFTLLSIALVMGIIRVWYRWHLVGFRGLQLDDYLTPVSGILFALVTSLAYLVGAKYDGLTNSYMTDAQRAAVDPNGEEAFKREMGSKIQVIGWSFYALELWTLKLCLVVFYSRLTTRLQHLNWRVKFGYIILGVTYIALALCILLGCPKGMQGNWQISPNPGPLCQPTKSPLNVFMLYLSNVVTDLYLLSIPLPLLWKVNISMRRKISLMLLFSGGAFIIAAGTVRAVVIIKAGATGALVGSQWACREIFVAHFCTNLPVIQPLLRSTASKMGLSGLFSRSHRSDGKSYPLDSKDAGTGSRAFKLSRLTGNKSTVGNQTQNGITTAAWGSDEHILEEGRKGGAGGIATNTKAITVAQEVTVVSEFQQQKSNHSSADVESDWGYDKKYRGDKSDTSSN